MTWWGIALKFGGAALAALWRVDRRVWIAVALIFVAVWFHCSAVDRAVGDAVRAAERKAEALAAQQAIAALEERARLQAQLLAGAHEDLAAVRKRLDDIAQRTAVTTREYQHHADAAPLPVECRADPDRVRIVNGALNATGRAAR